VIPLLALWAVVLLGLTGLALDGARAYNDRAELARAVDAAVLAGARSYRSGESEALREARAVAAANGSAFRAPTDLAVSFGVNEYSEVLVSAVATRPMRTLFMPLLGIPEVTVSASATAAVPPVDLVLILDQSGSLESQGAWNDLKQAAFDFVRYFDDDFDQMGLVSFQLHARNRSQLGAPFQGAVISGINQLRSAGDTNTGEGLRLALEQLEGPEARARAAKVVVFFTDGRPTAFRDIVGGADRAMAVYTTESGVVRGYFNDPDNLPDNQTVNPDGCRNVASCFGFSEYTTRQEAKDKGIEFASLIRQRDIYVYTIGLGNPSATDPLLTPDLDYLRILANEGGQVPDQPRGRMYFAPSSSELEAVFRQVAQDLLVRLTS
jgi:Flp pilus assembly protein TadG